MKLDADYAELLAECSGLEFRAFRSFVKGNWHLWAEGRYKGSDFGADFALQCNQVLDTSGADTEYFDISTPYFYRDIGISVRVDINNLAGARQQVGFAAVDHRDAKFLFLGLKLIEFLETLKGIMP